MASSVPDCAAPLTPRPWPTVPLAPVPSQPNGAISTTTPMYLWTPSSGATSYTLVVSGAGGFTTTLTLSQASCSGNIGACGYTQPTPLAPGNYTWQVRASNANGSSALSAAMAFSVP